MKASDKNLPRRFHRLSSQILFLANKGIPRLEFLQQILHMFLGSSEYDVVGLWVAENDKYIHGWLSRDSRHDVRIYSAIEKDGVAIPELDERDTLNRIRIHVLCGEKERYPNCATPTGSFWTGNMKDVLTGIPSGKKSRQTDSPDYDRCMSIAVIPLDVGEAVVGLLELGNLMPDRFNAEEIEGHEGVAQLLGIALVNKKIQGALRERIKELTCLYNTAQIMEQREFSVPETMKAILRHIPPAWQYPEITTARITLDDDEFRTETYSMDGQKQSSPIIINGRQRGVIEVVYAAAKPLLDEGPFLKEERSLIDALARQISVFTERKEAEEERTVLQEQLRHADRLATIGQLAAGVAHELNEPLGNILGFAQLAEKSGELPDQVRRDISHIVNASLQAREIIKKLMIFSRQMPTKRLPLDVNRLIEEGLYFFEMRCLKSGIELERRLMPDIPQIVGDQSQLNQVLVNLTVNAIQAMPEGGRLIIETFVAEGHIHIVVQDTGIGMNDAIMKKIFIPFFTTKDVNEGTGLGLAVVHGIISAHKGTITVSSTPGKGSRFEVILPVDEPDSEV